MKLKEDEGDLTGLQNFTSSLLEDLIGDRHSLEFHRRNVILDFEPKTCGSCRGID
jgi:hypothetical protein